MNLHAADTYEIGKSSEHALPITNDHITMARGNRWRVEKVHCGVRRYDSLRG